MKFYKEKILNSLQLKRLAEHRYSCKSESLLDPLLQPWWNWLVEQIPIWLAPNLITTVGLLVNVLTSLVVIWYAPDAKSPVPKWACALCALGLFIYQSLDAIDGKQARRTGTSTPLGELFDHGCDSISTVFVAASTCICVQLGYHPSWMFFQCFLAFTLFYCAHWQTYVSGTLRFGKIDVTEAQICIIVIQMISAIFGEKFWTINVISDSISLSHFIPITTFLLGAISSYSTFAIILAGGVGKNGSSVAIAGSFSFNSIICALFQSGCLFMSLSYCRAVKRDGGCGKNGSTIAVRNLMELRLFILILFMLLTIILIQDHLTPIFTGRVGIGKNGSTVAGTSVLSPIIPWMFVIVPAFIIYQKSEQNIFENYPILYILSFGMVAAKITNKLVVAHMSRSELDYMDSSLLGPGMLFLNQYFNTFFNEYYVLWICFIWVTFDLLRYSAQICLEFCDHLKINLFKIPYQTSNRRQSSAAQSSSQLNMSHRLAQTSGQTNNGSDFNGSSRHSQRLKSRKNHS